jgi:hypothetical protein
MQNFFAISTDRLPIRNQPAARSLLGNRLTIEEPTLPPAKAFTP